MNQYVAKFLLLFMGCLPFADAVAQLRSRDALYSFYDDPKAYATINVKAHLKGTEIEVCADVCDVFIAQRPVESLDLWDAVFLFKAIVSRSNDDLTFGKKNEIFANHLLVSLQPSSPCSKGDDRFKKTMCILRKQAHEIGFKHAEVKYDEGARCVVFRSFESNQRALHTKCTKVQ